MTTREEEMERADRLRYGYNQEGYNALRDPSQSAQGWDKRVWDTIQGGNEFQQRLRDAGTGLSDLQMTQGIGAGREQMAAGDNLAQQRAAMAMGAGGALSGAAGASQSRLQSDIAAQQAGVGQWQRGLNALYGQGRLAEEQYSISEKAKADQEAFKQRMEQMEDEFWNNYASNAMGLLSDEECKRDIRPISPGSLPPVEKMTENQLLSELFPGEFSNQKAFTVKPVMLKPGDKSDDELLSELFPESFPRPKQKGFTVHATMPSQRPSSVDNDPYSSGRNFVMYGKPGEQRYGWEGRQRWRPEPWQNTPVTPVADEHHVMYKGEQRRMSPGTAPNIDATTGRVISDEKSKTRVRELKSQNRILEQILTEPIHYGETAARPGLTMDAQGPAQPANIMESGEVMLPEDVVVVVPPSKRNWDQEHSYWDTHFPDKPKDVYHIESIRNPGAWMAQTHRMLGNKPEPKLIDRARPILTHHTNRIANEAEAAAAYRAGAAEYRAGLSDEKSKKQIKELNSEQSTLKLLLKQKVGGTGHVTGHVDNYGTITASSWDKDYPFAGLDPDEILMLMQKPVVSPTDPSEINPVGGSPSPVNDEFPVTFKSSQRPGDLNDVNDIFRTQDVLNQIKRERGLERHFDKYERPYGSPGGEYITPFNYERKMNVPIMQEMQQRPAETEKLIRGTPLVEYEYNKQAQDKFGVSPGRRTGTLSNRLRNAGEFGRRSTAVGPDGVNVIKEDQGVGTALGLAAFVGRENRVQDAQMEDLARRLERLERYG